MPGATTIYGHRRPAPSPDPAEDREGFERIPEPDADRLPGGDADEDLFQGVLMGHARALHPEIAAALEGSLKERYRRRGDIIGKRAE